MPDVVQKAVMINVPHPQVMTEHLRHNLRQRLRSWYMAFFQIPWLPETVLRLGNWRPALWALRRSSRPGAFTPDELDRYREAWSRPGAMTSMINWYRASFRFNAPAIDASSDKIATPTLLIWGAQDHFLDKAMAQPSIERCERGRLVMIETASHWVHHEEPERVNTLIEDFFTA
jgi:pimeloyl-ACP methyl ester carboxylesterase